YWDSKFGKGRPGWHIECSVMASHVLGEQLDIHSGGIDLAFPHHDNELAQAEAHFESQQWVNYFLHTGHLHIQGFKMSKSLKNFITIKEALNLYSPRQLRLYFLNQRWDAPCDFKLSSLHEAISAESFVLNFFTNLDAKIRSFAPPSASSTSHDHNSAEADLIADLFNTQQAVHSALCDSFDTPSVLKLLLSLINKANIYLSSTSFSPSPLLSISKYLTFIFDVFGVSFTSTSTSTSTSSSAPDSTAAIDHSSLLLPYLTTFSTFRDQVRQAAKIAKNSDILGLCDTFRDTELTKYGVVLGDQESGPALIKLVDPAYLKQQQQQQLQAEDQKKAAKQLAQQRKVDKLELAKIPPHQYFTTGGRGVEFSSFDLNGFPLTDLEGKPLSKSKVKKLQKLYDNHTKIHNDYLASIEGK
ncbi:Cysteine-tRNA ligase, cytoplasmic, partial [Zancudomyces culisetae]